MTANQLVRSATRRLIVAAVVAAVVAAGTCLPTLRAVASAGHHRIPIAYPDTWGAVDGLGRVLPDYREVGGIKKHKTVGIF